jgi:uncharacterized membrane protein (DUF485 family)
MLHKPVIETKKDNASNYKMRLGVVMFIIYGIIYAGFVAINLIKGSLMNSIVIFGLNLAVVYGFGLIIFAMILALIYNHMCTLKERELNTPKGNK